MCGDVIGRMDAAGRIARAHMNKSAFQRAQRHAASSNLCRMFVHRVINLERHALVVCMCAEEAESVMFSVYCLA